MKKVLILILLLSLSYGCAVRPVSNTGYSQNSDRGDYSTENKELNELIVLGINQKEKFEDKSIGEALSNFSDIKIPKGSSILLIQSGSEYPDSEMIESLSKHWNVNQLSGDNLKYKETNLNKLLRYTAATGGNSHLFVYWGIVETAEKNIGTKNISWVPIVGWSLPDEKINMRMRLKLAVIDIKTGSWQMFQPKPIEAGFFSSIMSRKGKDQEKVIKLKKAVYLKAAEDLYRKFAQ